MQMEIAETKIKEVNAKIKTVNGILREIKQLMPTDQEFGIIEELKPTLLQYVLKGFKVVG